MQDSENGTYLYDTRDGQRNIKELGIRDKGEGTETGHGIGCGPRYRDKTREDILERDASLPKLEAGLKQNEIKK